ncbi:DoxX family protein [uncultured Corynebacterium sp.]|uniref:DoxX family protein n=1 Tax=uncultured Corynebacterium sp. TaxID=159447 RepID=UPI0025E20AD0|nr:DoxX family protein [uncultured Corynebacterium sp.]
MTQNNSPFSGSGNTPDNARNFDDVDVPTYDPSRPQTMSFDSAGRTQSASAETAETAAFEAPSSYAAPAGGAGLGAGAASAAATPTTIEPVGEEQTALEIKSAERQAKLDARKADPRRGTIDFGLLFVRIALSVYLLVAGASTFFGLGGNEGLSGLESDFGDYAMPQVLAIAVPTLQLLAGAFLLLGLVTPLAAMFGLIVTGFTAIHELFISGTGLDIFSWPEAVWLSLVLFLINIAIQFTGPGVISLDFSRSWARRPLATSWIFIVLGIAAVVTVWWFGAGVNPL